MGSDKPGNLVYGVDDKPPLGINIMLGVEHACIYCISLIMPVMVGRMAGLDNRAEVFLVCMSMLAAGVGAVVQASKRLGSGYLCPPVCGPAYLNASIAAAGSGGLALLCGMTLLAGLGETALSRTMKRLRPLFPPEVTGLIVAMVGITIIKMAVSNMLGTGGEDQIVEGRELFLAVFTLGTIVGLNVWTKGNLKMYCALIGMVAGCLAAIPLGLLGPADWEELRHVPLFWIPFLAHPGWSFDHKMLAPFAIAMLCSAIKSVGDISLCQKINDERWKRADMDSVSKGVFADGVGCAASGLLGGMGLSLSTSNVGLSLATGATSRHIAVWFGVILAALAFVPALACAFVIMPRPVMGATLVFAMCFMIVGGMQIAMSRMLDARKTFVLGVALVAGLAVDMLPGLFSLAPGWTAPVFGSSLATAAITAVALNLLFRLGVKRKVELQLALGVDASDKLFTFMREKGREWGALPEVINKATTAMNELTETVAFLNPGLKSLAFHLSFDEYNLEAVACYEGVPCLFPEKRPSPEEALKSADAPALLSAYLVKQYTDHLEATRVDDANRIRLHFNH